MLKAEQVYGMSEKTRIFEICERYSDIMTLSSINGEEYKIENEVKGAKSEIVLSHKKEDGEYEEIMRRNTTWKTEMEIVAVISDMMKEIQEEQGNW